ncbi:MAG: c-type cytochrome [Rhodospirillales bacterium]|nr:c-type cytochrome [Rhodospirillales bacterium]
MTKRGILLLAALGIGLAAIIGHMLLAGKGFSRADADNPEMVAMGRIVYADHCAACHGKQLEGEPDWRTQKADGTLPAPPHDENGHTWHHGDELLFRYTKEGGAALAPAGFKSGMPGFAGILSDEQIWAALAFIKSTWPEPVRRRQEAMNR